VKPTHTYNTSEMWIVGRIEMHFMKWTAGSMSCCNHEVNEDAKTDVRVISSGLHTECLKWC